MHAISCRALLHAWIVISLSTQWQALVWYGVEEDEWEECKNSPSLFSWSVFIRQLPFCSKVWTSFYFILYIGACKAAASKLAVSSLTRKKDNKDPIIWCLALDPSSSSHVGIHSHDYKIGAQQCVFSSVDEGYLAASATPAHCLDYGLHWTFRS